MSLGSIILKPFAWLLLTLYNLVNNYGLALILFSLVVKIVLLYFSAKSKKGMMKTTRLQPKKKEIEKKHAGNKAKLNEELMKLYKENDVKPMSGCLWSLIPFPILIGLYSVIRLPLTHLMGLNQAQIDKVASVLADLGYEASSGAYAQITMAQQVFDNFEKVKAVVPEVIKLDFSFLGLNLAQTPSIKFITDPSVPFSWQTFGLFLIPLVSAFFAWLSSKVAMKTGGTVQQENTAGMMLMGPIMSLWIGFIMPAGLGIYWIANSVFAIIQDLILGSYFKKKLDAEDAVRLERQRRLEEERERKRAEYERLKAQNATTRNKNTSKKKIQRVERAEAEKRRAAAKGAEQPETPHVDPERPYARGRAYDPNRYPSFETVKPEEPKLSPEEAAALAEEEARRRDEEAFEKFLETGVIDENLVETEDEAAEETFASGETESAGEQAEESGNQQTEDQTDDGLGEEKPSVGGDSAGDPDNK
mgnify:CR=1 FL=1